ncbi:MAG: AMP-binding protein, partial [Stellaceae bacterium]
MGSLSSIAAGARQSISDAVFEIKVLHEAGVAALHRPDKAMKVVSALVRWGASPALGVTTAAIHYPHETALIDERGSLSFEQLQRRTNALAHAFERMGVGYGDGIGIMCRNHRGFIEVTLAAAKLGASALYLNTMFAGPQLVEVTRREGPK